MFGIIKSGLGSAERTGSEPSVYWPLPAVIFNDIFHWIAIRYFIDLFFDVIALIISITAIFFYYYI